MASDLSRLKATGLPYAPEKALKKRINSYIAGLVASSTTTSNETACLVLDTDHLLTTEALIDSAGVPPESIIIPNPDPQQLRGMLEKYGQLCTVQGTSHDLLRPAGGIEDHLNGRLLRCVYLDYNGSFGRDGYKTGRKKRDDLNFLLEGRLMASPCVLAISFSMRGIGETFPLEHWFNVKDYVESVVMQQKDLHMRWLDCLRYRHNPRSSPMMFLSAISWRGDGSGPTELPRLVLDGSEALWTERIDTKAEKQRDTGLTYPRWMAEAALDLCRKAAINKAYITAPHTPLGQVVRDAFTAGEMCMLWDSIPRPRHWLEEDVKLADVPGIVWCCEEGMLHLRGRRKSGLREDLMTLLKLPEKPRLLLLWNFSYSNVGERWKHEELFRFVAYVKAGGGKPLAAFNYNSPSSAVYFLVVSFDEAIDEFTFTQPGAVGLSAVDLNTVEHTKKQERVDIPLCKYLRAFAHRLELPSSSRVVVTEGPSLCWSSRLLEAFPQWRLLVKSDDPVEVELMSRHKLASSVSSTSTLPSDCNGFVLLYDHCWADGVATELEHVLAPNRFYCIGYHLVGRPSSYLLEPVSWLHRTLEQSTSTGYTLERVILCRSSAPYVYVIFHTFTDTGRIDEDPEKLRQLKFTVYDDWPTEEDGAFTSRVDKLLVRG
ncbi:hypothetical protein FOZ61_004159 [Perkinsus olseni]|uniref:Uncharacterized protein n=1 Tax=Perkinsus olseni TaxID=32597 RepID=A0A7J6LM76_PEROL|nr:hypothetical protein FOZ61_004159 [Perkinsus olseni]